MNLRYFALAVLLLSLSMCYDDSEEELYPTLTECDAENVTYSGTIQPIIDNYCLSCHGNNAATSGGNVFLRSYDEVYAQRVKILASIQSTASNPMPKGTMGLSACAVSQFTKWNADGSPNN